MAIAPLKSFRHAITNIPLRWVLVVPFVLQTVGAVTLVGYLSYQSGQRSVVNLSRRLMAEVGDRTTLYLKNTLATPHLINQLNADAIRLGVIPGFEAQDSAVLERFFWSQIQRFPKVSTIAIANERGGMVGSGQTNPFPSVYRTEGFAQGTFSASLVDLQGRSTNTITVARDYDVRDRPWYQTPKQAGRATWSPIYQFVTPGQVLGISAGLPIYTAAGKLRGVLATDITLDHLNHFLAELQISQSGQVFIIERSGLLVASSTNQPLFTQKAAKLERIKAAESNDPTMRETIRQLARSANLAHIDTLQQFQAQPSTVRRFVSVSPFRDQFGLDWLIVLVVPEVDFMAEIHANNARTALLCWLTLFAATAIGALTARWITKPILQLNRASQALARGEWQQPLVNTMPIAELKTLTHSFNQTADQLQQVFERIQTALAESQEKFTTVFRASPDPIAITSLTNGLILDVNDRFLEFYGYQREELTGKTTLELDVWADLDDRDRFLDGLQNDRAVHNLEVAVRLKSGGRKIVLVSAEVRALEGQDCVIVIIHDISDRKRAEIALQRYERIVSATVDAIALVDRQYCYQIVNQIYLDWNNKSYTDIVGHSVAELMGQTVFETIIKPRLDRCLAGETVQYNDWFEFPTLGRQFLSVTYSPYLEMDQTISGIVVSVRNLTPLKQAEAALRQSESRFQQLAANLPGVIYTIVHPPDGAIRFGYVSAAIEEVLEITPTQALANFSLLLDQCHPEDREALYAAVQRNLETLEPFSYEWRVITPSGKLKWLHAHQSQLERRENGELVGYGMVQDVSDRHSIDRVKDEFIAVVSHELRTPLTAIRGSLGILETGALDHKPETAKHMLKVASNNSERLVKLVNDILDLERLESGKTQLELQSCTVSELIQQAVDAMQVIATQANITITVTSIIATVQAAPDAIVQVLTNLLGNAIKFSPRGSMVWLSATLVDTSTIPENQIRFAIRDQGRGIPPDKLETIFGRFQQVDVSDSRRRGGTGLGLAICKSIVQQHHGQIWVESQVGKGSTFYFTLNIAPDNGCASN